LLQLADIMQMSASWMEGLGFGVTASGAGGSVTIRLAELSKKQANILFVCIPGSSQLGDGAGRGRQR